MCVCVCVCVCVSNVIELCSGYEQANSIYARKTKDRIEIESVFFLRAYTRIPPKKKKIPNTTPYERELFRPVRSLLGCRNQMVFISQKP